MPAAHHLDEVRWMPAFCSRRLDESSSGFPSVAEVVDDEQRFKKIRRAWGHCPGRWATSDAPIPSSRTGVYFGSLQSLRAIELLQIWVMAGVLVDGCVGRQRSLVTPTASTRLKTCLCFPVSLGVFVQSGRYNCILPVRIWCCLCFLI